MRKYFYRSFIILLALWQAVFSTVYPVVVLAEETLQTGDAASQASTQTEANLSQTKISLDEASTVKVDSQEQATVDSQTAAEAASGEVTAEVSSETLSAQTGSADAVAASETLTNTSNLAVSGSTESANLEAMTNQTAKINSTSSTATLSGAADIVSDGTVDVLTGFALAVADNVNLTNLNVVGADTLLYLNTITGEESKDINLYTLYENLLSQDVSLPQDSVISVSQDANINLQTQAEAGSGNALVEADLANLETGPVVAVANSVNLTNLNLVGETSTVFVINILGDFLGDILIPNINQMQTLTLPGNLEIINNQQANLDSSNQANATSGEVLLEGEGTVITGDATSIANTASLTNLVKISNVWVWLLLNNYGNWSGSLKNWDEPGSIRTLDKGTEILEKEKEAKEELGKEGSLTVITNQKAEIKSQTSADSKSGNATLKGNGNIRSGDAFSLANDVTLANFVGVGGSVFLGILNILGNWFGDLNVAYPDLQVSLTDNKDSTTAGSSQKYIVSVSNQGKAKIKGIDTDFTVSSDVVNFSEINRHIAQLAPGESYSYEIDGVISSTVLVNTQNNASVSVSSAEEELSKANNIAFDTTLILSSSESEKDKRTPDLKIDVWNNVNEFVYPGDTVLARIIVVNQSPFIAHDVKVDGSLSNDYPMSAIPMDWDLGDLKPGEKIEIDFSIGLIEELPAGEYYISAQAKGKSENGDEISTNWVSSSFLIKLKDYAGSLGSEVLADNLESEEVLGSSSNWLVNKRKYLPYIFGTSLLLLLFIYCLRKRMDGKRFLPILVKKKKDVPK